MIRALNSKGPPRAEAVCEICGASEVVVCDYVVPHGPGGVSRKDLRPHEAQVVRKLALGLGWAKVKGVLRCPACEAARKAKGQKQEVIEMAKPAPAQPGNVAPLREMTMRHQRQIMGLLELAYDDEAKRYKGDATDRSIAEALADEGVLPGWVAQVREAAFGPAGGNEAMEDLAADIARWQAEAGAGRDKLAQQLAEAAASMREFSGALEKVEDLRKRLDAIRRAVGPKAG